MKHKQVPFKVTSTGIEIEGLPSGTRVLEVPGALAKEMMDLRLHASDLDLAIQAATQLQTDKNEFSITNVSLFSAALVFYFRCFKKSSSRERLDPELVFATSSDMLAGHKFFEGLRDKHVVHDENNYLLATPLVTLIPGATLLASDNVITAIAQAGIDREPAYVESLRMLAKHAHQWAESRANEATAALALMIDNVPGDVRDAWPVPRITFPTLGDERKRR